jgi:hypothetical protein
MESISPAKSQSQTQRSLAALKIVSRLISHELHAQSATKTLTLSRDELIEIQTVIDIHIEESSRRQGASSAPSPVEAPLAVARN